VQIACFDYSDGEKASMMRRSKNIIPWRITGGTSRDNLGLLAPSQREDGGGRGLAGDGVLRWEELERRGSGPAPAMRRVCARCFEERERESR